MLIPLLVAHPSMAVKVVQATPAWVWGLLAGLLVLGFSQVRDRRIGAGRVLLLPAAMTGLSLWGMAGAFGNSPMFGWAMTLWMLAASLTVTVVTLALPASAATYDAGTAKFALPGSWVPLALIVGIFLTRYVVNVDLAMDASLARDAGYTLTVGALYGLCTGIFAGRALRLWRVFAAARAGLRMPSPAFAR